MIRRFPIVAALMLSSVTSILAQAAPKTGAQVLQRMHDAYAGKWYHTLTFRQKTTAYRNGQPTVSQWYESLRHTPATGTQLRIDMGDLAAGNGVLYTADSSWVVRAGKLASARASGNEFLPMIEGVYVQPVEQTMREIAHVGIDMSKVSSGTYDGRPVWVVGATSPADATSPQFWVDKDRNVVVRMIMGVAGRPMDVHLDKYERAGNGWLATKIEMYQGGAPLQMEEYSDWKTGIPLAPALFDPATWLTAPHWAK